MATLKENKIEEQFRACGRLLMAWRDTLLYLGFTGADIWGAAHHAAVREYARAMA